MKPSTRSIILLLVKETPTNMIKYVIFDMDGTLLDTERFFRDAWIETGKRWGFSDNEGFYTFVAGRPVHTVKSRFMDTYKKTEEEFEVFVKERVGMVIEMLKINVPVKPHCFELLDFLKDNGIKMALATSTAMYITERNMAITGIGKYMDYIITGDMVENGKPAPDIFLLAAKKLSADPKDCAVIEDSYNGLRAAHAAGMQAIMVIDNQEPTEETHSITVAECDDLAGVLEVIKIRMNE